MSEVFGREELNRPIDSERLNSLFSNEQKYKEQKDEMKNRISMALKNPVLQQGFEIICKENAELEAYNAKLLDGDIEKHNKIVALEKELAKREEQIEALNKDKDYFSDALDKQIEATYKVVEKLNKAKEIIGKFLNAKSIEETCVAESEAEQFLKEVSE